MAAVAGRDVEGEQASGAERVAVAEAAGDDDEVSLAEPPGIGRQLVDEDDLRLGAGELEGERGVAVAVRPGAGDDESLSARSPVAPG